MPPVLQGEVAKGKTRSFLTEKNKAKVSESGTLIYPLKYQLHNFKKTV